MIADKMFYEEVMLHIFFQYNMFCMNDTLITII